mmetsp:Transcript_14753/g.28399  ORF Transcript_14753/g.28399 Transcript_14753/m.28399 type:complete len:369 (+) Transcript_14753:122-1228(+)
MKEPCLVAKALPSSLAAGMNGWRRSKRSSSADRVADACELLCMRPGFLSGGDFGRVKVKVDPLPTVLDTPTVPSCASTSDFTRLRPSPVPPNWRVVTSSCCTNSWKMDWCADSGMPVPVSATLTWIMSSGPSPRASALTVMLPVSVNLTAFPSRLFSTCSRRSSSPRASGRSSGMLMCRDTSFLVRVEINCIACCTSGLMDTLSFITTSLLFTFMLAESRMSLMRPSSRPPLTSTVRRMRSTLGLISPQLPARMPWVSPMMPCSGVRSSCDVADRKVSFCFTSSSSCFTTSAWVFRSRTVKAILAFSDTERQKTCTRREVKMDLVKKCAMLIISSCIWGATLGLKILNTNIAGNPFHRMMTLKRAALR